MRKTLIGLAASALLAAAPAHAVINSFVAFLSGANEVAAGDPDGFGIATVIIDASTNTVSWSVLASNIETPLSGAHIHNGPAGVNGPVIVNFSGALSGNGLIDADLATVQDSGLSGADDPTVLEWSASEGRVLLSHDVNTMSKHAIDRIAKGLSCPGLLLVPEGVAELQGGVLPLHPGLHQLGLAVLPALGLLMKPGGKPLSCRHSSYQMGTSSSGVQPHTSLPTRREGLGV